MPRWNSTQTEVLRDDVLLRKEQKLEKVTTHSNGVLQDDVKIVLCSRPDRMEQDPRANFQIEIQIEQSFDVAVGFSL